MKMTDKELLDQYYAGDIDALGTIWEKYEKKIYNQIFFKTKGNIELTQDILQDGFIKAMKALDKGSYVYSGKSMGGWLAVICGNLFIDRMRANNIAGWKIENTEEVDFAALLVAEDDVDWDKLLSDEKGLRQMINTLSDDQRSIVIKRIYEKLPFNEIAKEEEISINTAIGRMRYALTSLRKLIESGDKINPSDKIEFRGMDITWKDIIDFLVGKADTAEADLKIAKNKVNLIAKVADGIKQLANEEVSEKKKDIVMPKPESPPAERGGKTKYTYQEAKDHVCKLGITSAADYKVEFELGNIPKGIPKVPASTYRGKGWTSWFDYLGKE